MRIRYFGDLKREEGKPSERVERLDALYKLCDAARRPHEDDWYANAQYLRGNQLDDLPTDVRRMIGRRVWMPKKSRKVQYVGNRMLALYRQALSFLLDSIGRQVAIPATNEIEDQQAAELGTDIFEYLGARLDERRKRNLAIGWPLIAGRALGMVDWNEDLDGMGPKGVIKGGGDMETRVLNPLQFYMDPWAESLEEATFVLVVGIRDVGELKTIFGESAKDLKPQPVDDQTYILDAILSSLTSQIGEVSRTQAPQREESCLLMTWYFAPTPTNPNGLVIWKAGDKELHESELPEGRMPFAEFPWLHLPGQAYPMPFCTPLRNPSHYQNVLRSQLIQLANAQLRGDTFRTGLGKVKQEVDPETGRKDLVADASVQKFEMMRYQLDWAASAKSWEDMWDDSQQIAGLRGSMIGENPPGVNTVGQLMLLKEPDVAGMKLFRISFENAYAKQGMLQLQVIQNHYEEQRLLRIVGKDKQIKVVAFFGSELKGVVDVQTNSLPPMTETERRQALAELAAPPNEVFGPYLDVLGRFSLQVKRSKLKLVENSGIPDAQEIRDELCKPMSWEELNIAANQIDLMDAEKEAKRREVELAQLEAMLNPPQEEEMSPEEQLVAQMMGGPPEQALPPGQNPQQPAMAAGGVGA